MSWKISKNLKIKKPNIFGFTIFRFFDFPKFQISKKNPNFEKLISKLISELKFLLDFLIFLKISDALERWGGVGLMYDEKTSFPTVGVDWDSPIGCDPEGIFFIAGRQKSGKNQ